MENRSYKYLIARFPVKQGELIYEKNGKHSKYGYCIGEATQRTDKGYVIVVKSLETT